jgi:hypothetical protein
VSRNWRFIKFLNIRASLCSQASGIGDTGKIVARTQRASLRAHT